MQRERESIFQQFCFPNLLLDSSASVAAKKKHPADKNRKSYPKITAIYVRDTVRRCFRKPSIINYIIDIRDCRVALLNFTRNEFIVFRSRRQSANLVDERK